jgi:hypothetical protein
MSDHGCSRFEADANEIHAKLTKRYCLVLAVPNGGMVPRAPGSNVYQKTHQIVRHSFVITLYNLDTYRSP